MWSLGRLQNWSLELSRVEDGRLFVVGSCRRSPSSACAEAGNERVSVSDPVRDISTTAYLWLEEPVGVNGSWREGKNRSAKNRR